MAKVSGLPTSFTIDDVNGNDVTFSNDAATVGLSITQALQDASGLDVTGTERIPLRGDWSAPVTGFFAETPTNVIAVFGDIRNHRAITLDYPGHTFTGTCLVSDFTTTVDQSGALAWSANLSGSDGVFPTFS